MIIDFTSCRRILHKAYNGANGKKIGGALMVTDPFDFRIVQKSGAFTCVNTEDVGIETKAGKGSPYVVVVMDDWIVELQK